MGTLSISRSTSGRKGSRALDPIDRLGDQVRRGVRLSMRCLTADGPTDVIGLVLGIGTDSLRLEDRHGRAFEVARAAVRSARVVPTIARGRRPDRGQPTVNVPAGCSTEAVRLCEVLTEIDFTEVEPAGAGAAVLGGSRAELRGEWVVIWLDGETDLGPLASWGARRNARNGLLVRPGGESSG